jgi:hypothetical protein
MMSYDAEFDLYSARSLKQKIYRATRTHYSDFKPTSLYSYSLRLRAIWFDPTDAGFDDLYE